MSEQGYIPLEKAQQQIIEALSAFEASLGRRAAAFFQDSARFNIIEHPGEEAGMMQCRQVGLDVADLKRMDMYMPDFAARFGPDFTEQINAGDKAVIDFKYVGTPESVKYLAHELGHALADDIQRENGKCFRDFSVDQLEQQAYFVQSIVGHHLNGAAPEIENSKIAQSWQRAVAQGGAQNLFKEAMITEGHGRTQKILEALGGNAQSPADGDMDLGFKRPSGDLYRG